MNIYKQLADIGTLYDISYYKKGEEKPWYYEYVDWNSNEEGDCYYGYVKDNIFDSIGKKIYYLQGIFESYSGHGLNKNQLNFANSQNTVERCKNFINEIYRELPNTMSFHGIISHTIRYDTAPLVHTLELDPKIVEFIKNYEHNL